MPAEKARSPREPPSKRKPRFRKPIPWFKIAWGFVVPLFLVFLSVWFYLLWYDIQERCTRSPQVRGIKVNFAGPAFLPVGDEAGFLVTVVNERSTAADLSFDLRYVGTSLCASGDGQSLRVDFGLVQPGERVSRQIAVFFPACWEGLVPSNRSGEQADFEMWLSVDAQPPERIDTITLPVAPLVQLKTFVKWLGGLLAVFAGWIGKELWEQIKKTA